MSRRCRRAAATAATWFVPFASPMVGQTVGTLDIGASVVEYDGFLVSGAAVVSPALRFDALNVSLGTQATWTVFESGNQILQGTAAAAWLTPPGERWRMEFSGSVGTSKYADAPGYGHALARTRVHVFDSRVGGWVGGATGGSFGATAYVPLEVEVAGWSVRDRLAFVGKLTGTWLDGDRYVDVLGAVRWTAGGAELGGRVGARPWTDGGGGIGEARTGVYADVSAHLPLGETMSVAASAGSYPSDPVRRVLAAKYVTVGLRLSIVGSAVVAVPTITRALVRAARDPVASAETGRARLEIAASGFPRTLRVHVPGAKSVELMGDFTDWQTVELTRVGAATWEIRLELTPGVYRVNVRIDRGTWLVPAGARLEQTEFGGAVGVVVIP